MDEITQSIRELYEEFPYPAGAPAIRVASDARLLMSYGSNPRTQEGPIKVLDAGCGRGVGLIANAITQPDVEFYGIDINRIAIAEIKDKVNTLGLDNVTVREVNLMTLEGLDIPEGGFDVIFSSGVLHHLSDPVQGLEKLRSVLAPHGVISLMVYATFGRQPLYRLIEATKLLIPDTASTRERIPHTRQLADFFNDGPFKGTPWEFVAQSNDTEFVDLCLNPNETSYSVESMWNLLTEADMHFLRWAVPSQWSIDQLPEGELRTRAQALSEYDQYRVIEQATWNRSLELIVGHAHNAPRPPLTEAELESTAFAVNPEVTFDINTRSLRTGKRIESISYTLGAVPDPVYSKSEAHANALMLLWDQTQAFTGDSFINFLEQDGVSNQDAKSILKEFTEEGLLYRPHTCDV